MTNGLEFSYTVKSFRGKQIINDEEDKLQENDSKLLWNGTM